MSEEDFKELGEILLEASGVFLEYALIHSQKGNDDKSTRNNILSQKQDRALKLLRKIYQNRTFTKEEGELKPVFKVNIRHIYTHDQFDKAVVFEFFVNNHKHSTYSEGLAENTSFPCWITKQMEFVYDMGRAGKPTFTKEDVEKALLAISELHSGDKNEGK